MKAEIIAVGTEMLVGQIVNTNARDISLKFAELGIDVYFHTVVGDNANRLLQAIKIAQSRADLLLFTGGLGPTMDDLTKDVLAQYLGRNIEIHKPSLEKIEQFFSSRGVHMVESNIRQANMIEGATPLHNEVGLAVGNALRVEDTLYILLPGPPHEMREMLNGPAEEWLRQVLIEEQPLYSRILKFAGIGESNLEDRLMPLIKNQTDPTIAPYAKEGEVSIRVSTKAASKEEADEKIDHLVSDIFDIVGEYMYAQEDVPIESEILHIMNANGITLATAESCSGGLFARLLTKHPGTSPSFVGGVVTYTNQMKHKLLNIPMEMLEGENAPGAVSEETAIMMAENVRSLLDSTFGLSITGVAGPATSEGKPVGTVFVAIAQKGKPTVCYPLKLNGSRQSIQLKSVKHVQYRLWQRLREHANELAHK